MKIMLFFAVVTACILFPGESRCQTWEADTLRAAFRFADSALTRDSFRFVTVEPEIPADMQSILIRFNDAVAANKDWFFAYRDKYAASGKPLPYDERFGISYNEYQKMQRLEALPPQLAPVDTQEVAVVRANGYIRFKGNGNAHLLDYLEVNLQKMQLVYAGDTVPFTGPVTTGPSNPYGQWSGYVWRLEKTDASRATDADQLNARVIEINLGLPSRGDRIFLRIKYQDLRVGVTTAKMELLGYIY
jgi:hypothetical protein